MENVTQNMITSFHHASFTALNVEKSVSFYRDVLGMTLLSIGERDSPFSEKVTAIKDAHLKIAYLEGWGIKLELIEYLSPPYMQQQVKVHNRGLSHICFLVTNITAIVNDLRSKGVVFRSEPVEIQTGGMKGGYTVLLNDPDGNSIELVQPPKK